MALSAALLAVAGELTQRINDGVVARGFEGLRPAHGFASDGDDADSDSLTYSWDINGAASAGLNTFWIQRSAAEVPEELGFQASAVVKAITDLAPLLRG